MKPDSTGKQRYPQALEERRLRIYTLNESDLIGFLNVWRGFASNLLAPKFDAIPDDAFVVRVGHNFAAMRVEAIVASMEFDRVPDGQVPPTVEYDWVLVRWQVRPELNQLN
jgi:hypothetical protein